MQAKCGGGGRGGHGMRHQRENAGEMRGRRARRARDARWNRGGMAAEWRRNGGGAYKSGRGRPLIRPQKQITHKLNAFLAGKKRAGHIIQLSPAHLYAPQRTISRQTMAIVVAGAYKMRFKPALICPRPKIGPKRRGTLPAKSHKGHISRPIFAVLYAPTAKNGLRTDARGEKRPANSCPRQKSARNQTPAALPRTQQARRITPTAKINLQKTPRIIFLYITPRQNLLHCYAGIPPA